MSDDPNVDTTGTADYEQTEIPVEVPPAPPVEVPEYAALATGQVSINISRTTFQGADGYYYVIAGQAFFLPKAQSQEMAQYILSDLAS